MQSLYYASRSTHWRSAGGTSFERYLFIAALRTLMAAATVIIALFGQSEIIYTLLRAGCVDFTEAAAVLYRSISAQDRF